MKTGGETPRPFFYLRITKLQVGLFDNKGNIRHSYHLRLNTVVA